MFFFVPTGLFCCAEVVTTHLLFILSQEGANVVVSFVSRWSVATFDSNSGERSIQMMGSFSNATFLDIPRGFNLHLRKVQHLVIPVTSVTHLELLYSHYSHPDFHVVPA